jgi:hypothetical protein
MANSRVSVPATAAKAIRINTIGERSELTSRAGQFQVDLQKGAPVYLLMTNDK